MTKTTVAGRMCAIALSVGLASCGGSSRAPSTTASAPPSTSASAPARGTTLAPTAGTTSSGRPATGPAGPTGQSSSSNPTNPVTATAGGPGLSQVQLAAKAGAICSAATAQGRRLVAPPNLTTSPKAAAAYFDKAVPPLDAETKAFQALVPAPAVSAQWEAVLGAQVALDRLAEGLRQNAHTGRPTSLADVTQLVTVGRTIANAAVRLGARCV